MNSKLSSLLNNLPLPALLLAGLILVAACTSTPDSDDGAAPASPSGPELWAQNCRRCHNFRSPSEFDDAQWDVAMFHMRVRANLTGEEYRAIRTFLKSSN